GHVCVKYRTTTFSKNSEIFCCVRENDLFQRKILEVKNAAIFQRKGRLKIMNSVFLRFSHYYAMLSPVFCRISERYALFV
ncbi:MAG: hypothetical protein ACI3W5_13500, partial [Faecousia sp.]